MKAKEKKDKKLGKASERFDSAWGSKMWRSGIGVTREQAAAAVESAYDTLHIAQGDGQLSVFDTLCAGIEQLAPGFDLDTKRGIIIEAIKISEIGGDADDDGEGND